MTQHSGSSCFPACKEGPCRFYFQQSGTLSSCTARYLPDSAELTAWSDWILQPFSPSLSVISSVQFNKFPGQAYPPTLWVLKFSQIFTSSCSKIMWAFVSQCEIWHLCSLFKYGVNDSFIYKCSKYKTSILIDIIIYYSSGSHIFIRVYA